VAEAEAASEEEEEVVGEAAVVVEAPKSADLPGFVGA